MSVYNGELDLALLMGTGGGNKILSDLHLDAKTFWV